MPKLVTCCYCGARATLAAGRSGMLACEACGAPIQRVEAAPASERTKPAPVPLKPDVEQVVSQLQQKPDKKRKPKKQKKRKGLFSRALDEVWDKVEDIFD
ncbi:hypothetical protein KBY31_06220 [Ruegeria pomeroyi]|nr:hypothetical protein [Ruegeria pomeroyi]